MKKIIIFLFVLFSLSIFAQVTITMEQDGGVYKVPCVVNGAKMKFIFDTGAAHVCLSESMAEYLLDNDYISKDDIIGLGASQVADGRIVDHVKINLKDIEIAGLHLKDVEAVVVEGQRTPLLLGQSAIQKLGKVSIEGNKLIINNGEENYAKRLQQLRNNAEYLDRIESYKESLPYWEEYYTLLWAHQQPNDEDYYNFGECYYWAEEYSAAIKYYSMIQDKTNNIWLLQHLGIAYYNIQNYRTAIYFLNDIDQTACNMVLRELETTYQKYGDDATAIWDNMKDDVNSRFAGSLDARIQRWFCLSQCYYNIGQNEKAGDLAARIMTTYFKEKYPKYHNDWEKYHSNISILEYVESKNIHDSTFALHIFNCAIQYFLIYGKPHCLALRVAAEMGNADARELYDKSCY